MPKSNNCDYLKAYEYYLSVRSIKKVKILFKKREDVLIREWKTLKLKYPIQRIRKRGYNLNHPPRSEFNLKIDYFKVIDTVEKAYFLGLMYADGSVGVRKSVECGNDYSFRISLQEDDKYILEKFRIEIGISKLKKQKLSKNSYPSGKNYERCNMFALNVYRREFVTNLINLGVIPNKTYNELKIPNIPVYLVPHFIRGYFDGDGCIGVYKTFNTYQPICYICSKTSNLLIEIQKFLGSNIDSYIKNRDGMYFLFIRRNSILSFWDIIRPKNSEITMLRKQEKFEFYRTYVNNKIHDKQGELLETPLKEDNQQPSLLSNELEGSTTNTQILTGNAVDGNSDKSALPTYTKSKTKLKGVIFTLKDGSKKFVKIGDDIV